MKRENITIKNVWIASRIDKIIITTSSSKPRLSLKSVSNCFSQSSHVSFGLSLRPSILKLFRLSWSSKSISLLQ